MTKIGLKNIGKPRLETVRLGISVLFKSQKNKPMENMEE